MIGVAASSKSINAETLSLPESGEVIIASAVGTPLNMGKYLVLTSPDVTQDVGAKFTAIVADGLSYSYEVNGNALYLIVAGGNEAVWTGDVDGDISNPANWFLNMSPNGRSAVINVSVPTILTCSSSITPTSIVFQDGCAAVTIARQNAATISGVDSVINNSSNIQKFDVPVVFSRNVALTYSDYPIDFAGGATGETLQFAGRDEGGWHLKGVYNIQSWLAAPYCYIDTGATVNVEGATANLGDVRIELGGTLNVGTFELSVSSDDANKWALYYNRGHFIVRDTFTNTSSVTSAFFSNQDATDAKGTNVFKRLVNTPTANAELLWGKYGDIALGFGKWSRATFRIGSIICNQNSSPIASYRSVENVYYFEESGSVVEEGAGHSIRFLETATFKMCTFDGEPTEMLFDCNISNVLYRQGMNYYGDFVACGGGKMTLAPSRVIDIHTRNVTVTDATILSLSATSKLSANTLKVSECSTLLVTGSGVATVNANTIDFSQDSVLMFNFTSRTSAPVLEAKSFQPKKVSVTSLPKVTPCSGIYTLTTFELDPAQEIEVINLPKWARRVYVDEDKLLKVQVKSAGLRCIIR